MSIIDKKEKRIFKDQLLRSSSRDCEEYVLCCKYSPLGDVFAVGLGNGAIKVSYRENRSSGRP